MSTAPKKTKIEAVETGIDSELPDGWCEAGLDACVAVLDGQRVPVNSDERKLRAGTIPYYGATGQVGWINDFLFDEELVLLGEDGAPFLDKSKPIAYITAGKSWVNNHAHVLRAIEGLTSNKFLKYFLDSFDFSDYVTGSTRLKLTQTAMNSIPVSLAPLPEQSRIVEKIEAADKELTRIRKRLSRASVLLKNFRQAVLAAACSGKLTEDWRKQNPKAEPAKKLLERTAVKRSKTKRALRESSNTDETYDLPSSWAWAMFDDTCSDITVGHVGPMTHEYLKDGVPFLRSQNVREFRFESVGLKFISQSFHRRLAKSALHPGDVAVVRSGYPGVSCVIPDTLPEANCADLVVVRPSSTLNSHYACIFINSSFARNYVESEKVGIAQGHFNVGSMRKTPLPLPPLEEQVEIVREVEALFKLADAIERRVAAASLRAKRLTQAILAKAFRGELVPTEAELARREGREYEPASVLLERIKAEREKDAATAAANRKPGLRRKKVASGH